MSDADVARAIATLRAGGLAIVPTDTVYGLAADGESEAAARRLYEAKGRASIQPTALVLASVDELLARVPDLPDPALRVARALLPGPFTLVVPNRRRRYAWLNIDRPDALGIRVPALGGPGGEVLTALGALVATMKCNPTASRVGKRATAGPACCRPGRPLTRRYRLTLPY